MYMGVILRQAMAQYGNDGAPHVYGGDPAPLYS